MVSSSETFVVAAVIQQGPKILIVRRGPTQSGAGFWEFPGGKVEPHEGPEQALVREIHEELGVQIQVVKMISEKVHAYPKKVIRLRVFWARLGNQELRLTEHDAFRWLRPEEIVVDELSAADRPFVPEIIETFEVES